MVDFVNRWVERTDITAGRVLGWIGIRAGKFHDWKHRYGKVNEHNAEVPRDFWLEPHEKQAILDFQQQHPLEGYRRLTFMMLDAGVVAAAPSTVHRVLQQAGVLERRNPGRSLKGTGFVQPLCPHQHWHADVSYINIGGTFFYLCSLLDGCSRYIVHWEIRPAMTEADVQTIIQRAREKFPDARPRIISDNGPQFIAKDFKEFVRLCGMTHVRTSPYYPQSNGKIERFHRTLKGDCIRPGSPLTFDDAQRITHKYVQYYNTIRLHSALGYVSPEAKLLGREPEIFAERDRKLEAARERRRQTRRAARGVAAGIAGKVGDAGGVGAGTAPL